MAKIKFTGIPIPKNMIPGYTIYLTKKGYWQVRKIDENISDRIKTDPNYEMVRQNATEFGQAGKMCKLIKQAFNQHLKKLQKTHMFNRLSKALLNVIKTDTTNEHGKRALLNGQLKLLEGFEFNDVHNLFNIFSAPFEVREENGSAIIAIDSFTPDLVLNAPDSATNFRIFAANAIIKTQNHRPASDGQSTTWMVYDKTPTPQVELTCKLDSDSESLNILALGIEFRSYAWGAMEEIAAGSRTAFAIIKVLPGKSVTLKNTSL